MPAGSYEIKDVCVNLVKDNREILLKHEFSNTGNYYKILWYCVDSFIDDFNNSVASSSVSSSSSGGGGGSGGEGGGAF